MDGIQAPPARGSLAEAVERLLAEATAGAVGAAHEAGRREGYAAGQHAEREAWRAKLWALLAEMGEQPEAPEAPPPEHDEDGRGGEAAEQRGESGAVAEAHAGAACPPEGRSEAPAVPAKAWQDWRTPAREARLRDLWPREGVSMAQIFAALKEIDGPPMPGDAENARHWGRKLGLGQRLPAPPAPAAPAAPPEAAVCETPQMVRARELLAMRMHPNDIKAAVRLTATEFEAIRRAHAGAA